MDNPIRGKLPRRARGTSATLYDELAEIDRTIAEIYVHHDDPSVQWQVLASIRRQLEQIFEDYGMELASFESATTMPAWRIK